MIFIPAIDLLGGECVRLTQGDYSRKKVYSKDPLQVALCFEKQGAGFLHLVDLDGARNGSTANLEKIKRITSAVSIPVEVGGGVRDEKRVQFLLEAGVKRVILGSLLVDNPDLAQSIVRKYGKKVAAGIDAREGMVRVSGWTRNGGIMAFQLGIKVKYMGFSLIIYTDISRDGMLEGPDTEGIRKMAEKSGLPVIASGGISSIEDLKKIKPLENVGVKGVIAGKAIYEGKLDVAEAVRVLGTG